MNDEEPSRLSPFWSPLAILVWILLLGTPIALSATSTSFMTELTSRERQPFYEVYFEDPLRVCDGVPLSFTIVAEAYGEAVTVPYTLSSSAPGSTDKTGQVTLEPGVRRTIDVTLPRRTLDVTKVVFSPSDGEHDLIITCPRPSR